MSIAVDQLAGSGEQRRYLYGPWIDFALLGGGSLFALLLIRAWIGPGDEARQSSLATTLLLANLINHPHFAHSYQIFYQGFFGKLTLPNYPKGLRRLYLFSGLIAPAAIAGFIAWAIMTKQPHTLGLAANLMFFLVGWHYVKQGYGMAMVDAVLKRAFFSDAEKRALLINAYAVWAFSWLMINHVFGGKAKDYYGVEYFVLPVPIWLLALAGGLIAVTTAWMLAALFRRLRSGKPIAWNGIAAYLVSLYAWLLVRDPIILLWVPLFHSLQYLAVVWRYQSNKFAQTSSGARPHVRLALFIVAGAALGYVGFWALPSWLDANVSYDRTLFGNSLFFFACWIFINVHHYLLDTVMWRKGNPDVARYLFQARS